MDFDFNLKYNYNVGCKWFARINDLSTLVPGQNYLIRYRYPGQYPMDYLSTFQNSIKQHDKILINQFKTLHKRKPRENDTDPHNQWFKYGNDGENDITNIYYYDESTMIFDLGPKEHLITETIGPDDVPDVSTMLNTFVC